MKIPGLLIAFLITCSAVFGQQGVVVAGGENGTGATESFSLGQVDGTCMYSTNGFMVEGLQQPYEISQPSGIKEPLVNLLNVFPIPTRDAVSLTVSLGYQGHLTYQLFDLQGRSLDTREIVGNQMGISLRDYSSSIFFLKVYNSKGIIKTFKIIKIQ
jgi:hypothetical protein